MTASLAAALALGACAPGAPVLRHGALIPPGESAVIGRLVVWEADRVVIGGPDKARPASGWEGFHLALVPDATQSALSEQVKDGALRWHLPPGRYALTGFAIVGGSGRFGPVGAFFEVPPGARAVCIGTLHLALASKRPRLSVENDCEAETAAARHLVPTPPIRALLSVDDALAGACFDPALSGKISAGGLDLHVVRPITPSVDGVADSISPTLRWEALGGDLSGLAFDVRVFKAVRVGNDLEGMATTWGTLVASRDALAEPAFKLERPLEPGAQYLWQVRQRRGQCVGPWSRYDSTLILIIYNRWRRGVPFQFRTPGGEAPPSTMPPL